VYNIEYEVVKVGKEFMSQMSEYFNNLLILIRPSSIIDILLVAFVVYQIIGWIKFTQAAQVVKGIVFLLLATQVSEWFGLHTVNYLLKSFMTVGLIALIIVFQPELRRALEHIGRTSFFKMQYVQDIKETQKTIDEIIEAINDMSNSKTGALIVIERETGLEDIMTTGTYLEAIITSELLLNIFTPNTPLHDGAVIIRISENRLKAASCLLPLTENKNVSKTLGTRHRAGLGMSENCDAIVIIVSEESGVISYASRGRLYRYLDIKSMNEFLKEEFLPKEEVPKKFKFWGNNSCE